MKKQENWKKIVINGIETFYSVSDLGRIRNDSTGTFLKGSISKNGYRMVHLRYRVDKVCSVHRLVARLLSHIKIWIFYKLTIKMGIN
jgi:hypothetical protein